MQSAQNSPLALAQQAREVFLHHVADALPELSGRLTAFMLDLLEKPSTMTLGQERRDFYIMLQQRGPVWVAEARKGVLALARLAQDVATPVDPVSSRDELALVGEDTVEVQILAARVALAAMDKGSGDFNDLRLRLQHLESTRELAKMDPVHALNVAQAVVDAWLLVGLPHEQWLRCQSAIQPHLSQAIADAYAAASRFLLEQGVLPEIDLRGLVRRTPAAPAVAAPPSAEATAPAPPLPQMAAPAVGPAAAVPPHVATAPLPPTGASPAAAPANLVHWLSQRVPRVGQWLQQGQAPATTSSAVLPPASMPGEVAWDAPSLPVGAVDAAPALWQLMAQLPPVDWSSLAAGRAGLQAQTRALKAQLESDEEKAIVEVVGLIFDSILTEDRIPSSIRVWFARLQMPVLRHAMTDPGFLSDAQHPARRLIDRMGACVMGFDTSVSLVPLEHEIKRIVQVIEQYPDTGRRVFELTYQEFQDFLARHLREPAAVHRIADVAQQAEQKEALTVQYTIELRQLLARAPVPEAVRQFLFQSWAEVMAMVAVGKGVTSPQAKAVRQTAADLVWAVGAKPSRQERAQVIARVPALLNQLRDGLALLGQDASAQEPTLKTINDALADAFMARNGQIDPAWLQGLTESLDQIEGYLEGSDGPLAFDRDTLEMITGTDASDVTTLMDTGVALEPEALVQAELLETGAWFRLQHEAREHSVQLAWLSAARQLYLFVSVQQHAFLMQQGRVAQCLQAQLLQPLQSEGLVDQATRRAVQVLDAEPERLLA